MAWHGALLKFEHNIRLDLDVYAHLRKKRDVLIERVSRNIALPVDHFQQGSYAMSTAVWPLPGADIDIDVGLVFGVEAQPDPVQLKRLVHEAVLGHTSRGQEIRRHCVTVHYAGTRSLPPVHVDLAVYAPIDGELHLAVGKAHTPVAERAWLPSDPRRLLQHLRNNFEGPDRDQLRRVIRYLKRWKDLHFPQAGTGRPTGIALTLLAAEWFLPVPDDDLAATRRLLARALAAFQGGRVHPRRLVVELPAAPYNDVFERMTDPQMGVFEQKLATLHDWLVKAAWQDRRLAERTLQRAFGEVFTL